MTTLVPLGATRWRQSTLHQGPGAPAARTAQRAPARPARPATEPASGRARGGNARTALEDGPAVVRPRTRAKLLELPTGLTRA